MNDKVNFLNGNISISKKLYNIFYTIFCIAVLILVLISFATFTTKGLKITIDDVSNPDAKYVLTIIVEVCIIIFLGHKLFDKRNYKR